MGLRSIFATTSGQTSLPVRPSSTLYFLLAGAFVLTLVPHALQLPLWITLSILIALGIRTVIEAYHLPLPSTLFCGILAICLLVGIFLQFHMLAGRDSGTAFTVGLLAIKFFELRGPRDVSLIIFSCFFVVMSALLYSQAIELFIYCLIMMWLLTALLIRSERGDHADDRLLPMLGSSGILFLQAVPLMLFLFFFFPRFSGKLQFTLNDSPIGLTDRVTPGSIAKLSDNDEPAMYVRFTGESDIPGVDAMYWRALVLTRYQGSAWVEGPLGAQLEKLPAGHSGKPIVQEVTIWPHSHNWLFALDTPIQTPVHVPFSDPAQPWALAYRGSVVRLAAGQLDHRERYMVISSSEFTAQAVPEFEKRDNRELPLNEIDPRVQAMAKQWRSEHPFPDDEGYIRTVLRYFRHGFVYSATPGQEPAGHEQEWLADFLFERKSGFCEHYASAFAILMRLGGIPARLVVGYQGAEYNPYDNTYRVLQSNAHAWDEVYLESKHRWVRYDPTAILSTGETGPLSSTAGQDSNSTLQIKREHARPWFGLLSPETYPAWMRDALHDFQMRRDQVEANWDDWVFSYNPEAQSRLTEALGLGQKNYLSLILACAVAIGSSVFIFRYFMKRRQAVSLVENFYDQFCRAMAQRGILRETWEGPIAYTTRAAEAVPEKSRAIRDAGALVAQSRYGRSSAAAATPEDLQALLALITAPEAASSSREN